jgi:hypothetical protein
MSWRPGELWLDTDVPWFQEASASVVFVPAPIPSFGPPPGLAASRQRRAAWERRRHARRARATALALSPTVVLALAALRTAGEQGRFAGAEDPPSLTLRLSSLAAGPAAEPVRLRARHDTMPRSSSVPADAAPKIDWHHATSAGLPYRGTLIDGTQLPVEGPDWVTWDPVTDSAPNAPTRLYGNERTVRAIVAVTRAYRIANPGAPRVVVGDISREGGGPMTDEHVSHQNGLDVDVYFPRLDGTLRAPVAPDQIDHRLAQDLLDRFVAAGAQMIFVGYSTGLHGPAGVVVPYSGHEYHMHVRFARPGR